MKILITLLFLSIYGCLPTDGGYIADQDQGAVAPDQAFPDDYSALQNYFSDFEGLTPSTTYTDFNGYFSVPENIISTETPPPATPTSQYFMQNGLPQNLMFSSNPSSLGGKTVAFELSSLNIKSFWQCCPVAPGDFVEIPTPEDEIPIGTIVLVSINATENGVSSTRFQNSYMLKIKNGSSFWYVWYGNQAPYTP